MKIDGPPWRLNRSTAPFLALQLCWCSIWCAAASAQSLTIPEMAAKGEPVHITVNHESVGASLEQLCGWADIVAQGRVREIGPQLSDDEHFIYTEFALDHASLIGWTSPKQRRTPDPVQMVFRQLGGTLTINGIQVTMVSTALPVLSDGSQAIVFLRALDGESNEPEYEIVDPAGAFGLDGGQVVPLSRTLNNEAAVRGRSAAEIRTLIAAHRESLAKPK